MFHNIPAFTTTISPLTSSICTSRVLPRQQSQSQSLTSIHTTQFRPRTTTKCTLASPPSTPTPTEMEEPVKEIHGVEEYLNTLRSNVDSLVILKIFAPWCRSCKALTPKVNRLAREYSHIKFFKMNYEQNKDLCKRLGIYSMPTFIMYYGQRGELDKFTCGPARTAILTRKIVEFERGFCLLDENKDKPVKQPAYQKPTTITEGQKRPPSAI